MSDSDRELSRTDRKYLDLAAQGLSSEEIAEQVPGDQTPAMIAFRIKQLLAARSGWLSIAEERALHLHDLQRLKEKAVQMLDMEEGNRALTGVAALMQQIGQRLDIAHKDSDETLGAIRKAQAREFAAVLEVMYEGVARRLSRQYPEVDKNQLRTLMGEEFEAAVGRVDALVEEVDA